MRERGDTTIDFKLKEIQLKEIMETYEVLFAIDDNPFNCVMFQKYVPTLQVLIEK